MGQSTDQGANQRHDEPTFIGPNDSLIRHGWHWNFGFLRRPERDNEEGYRGFCYEAPDGDMIYTERSDHETICFLNEWLDGDTGEKYLTLDPRPTKFLVEEYGSRIHPGRSRL